MLYDLRDLSASLHLLSNPLGFFGGWFARLLRDTRTLVCNTHLALSVKSFIRLAIEV